MCADFVWAENQEAAAAAAIAVALEIVLLRIAAAEATIKGTYRYAIAKRKTHSRKYTHMIETK